MPAGQAIQELHPAPGGPPGRSSPVPAKRLCRGQPPGRTAPGRGRALTWPDVDLGKAVVCVIRSDRFGSDTKTPKSRRGLKLPGPVVEALREEASLQEADKYMAGKLWEDHGLVFCTATGRPPDASHVRREFKRITKAAGLGTDWTPREMRHTFVSVLSDNGMPLQDIADLVGHSGTRTTETVYRHQLTPVITKGATAMEGILKTARAGARKPKVSP